MSYQLWSHQLEAVAKAKDRNDFALFFETGTGKTATAISILKSWCDRDQAKLKTLILCPPIVVRQWKEEIAKYSSFERSTVLLEGPGAKRLKTFSDQAQVNQIFITNYETLLMRPVFEEFVKTHLDVLICDESHKLKSPDVKRSKLAALLSKRVKRKIIMTGTPVLNTPMDLFSQFLVLDNGVTFGQNFFVFRATYFYDKNAGMPKHSYFPNWQPRPGLEEKIQALIGPKSLRVKKSECLDLPPLVKKEIPVELAKEQLCAYQEMRDELVAYLDDKVCVASMALTKLLRLQQIVTGFVSVESPEGDERTVHRFKDVPRVQALHDVLEDVVPHHKVLVWACFKENYEQIRGVCERLGVGYVEITGERTETQKRQSVESFRQDDGVRVCIANPKAGGVGLNLIEASYSVYFSRTYSLEDDIQSEARNYRGGSERHARITRIDLVTRRSVDEIILAALKQKQNIAENLLDIKQSLQLL
jgi:SNF2 family DNA or RNA helicase